MSAIQHITIPNSTLRRFLDENNEIYYLDLDSKEIKKIPVDTSGETPRVMYNTTKKEVFSEEADEYIRIEAENKMGEAYQAIKKHIEGKSNDFKKITKFEEINQKYKDDVIKAIAIQTARQQDFVEKIGLKVPNDKKLFDKAVNVYSRMLENLFFNIAIIHRDNTDSTFVLPPSHCIFYGDSIEDLIIFIPLSPYDALTLMTKENYERCIVNDIHNCVNLKDSQSVNNVNYSAFITAQSRKNKHLIGYKKQLEYIRDNVMPKYK